MFNERLKLLVWLKIAKIADYLVICDHKLIQFIWPIN